MDLGFFGRPFTIPQYLAPASKEELCSELESFPSIRRFYINLSVGGAYPLQGDSWDGFEIFDDATKSRTTCRGVILSNSCDIDPANLRRIPPRITFARLVRLDRLQQVLIESGSRQESVNNFIADVRKQQVTDMVYFPAIEGMAPEQVALLGEVHSMPLSAFNENRGIHQFRLSNAGFYTLIVKISVHYSRLFEGIDRTG